MEATHTWQATVNSFDPRLPRQKRERMRYQELMPPQGTGDDDAQDSVPSGFVHQMDLNMGHGESTTTTTSNIQRQQIGVC